jgi:hypothetical protein
MIDKIHVNMGTIPVRVPAAFEYGQFVLDETALKDSNYYVPEDSGDLQDSGLMHSKIGDGELRWKTPYSRRLYYNPQYNFSRDKNPNARGLWWEAAKSEKRKQWLEQADKAVKSRI